jgi:penicillin-binding protein 2
MFIGFAPVDDPKIALAVIVEHGGGGSSVAAPIARELLDEYLIRESTVAE